MKNSNTKYIIAFIIICIIVAIPTIYYVVDILCYFINCKP